MLKPNDDSGESSTENEAVIIIDRWLEAISSFYEWHNKLNKAIAVKEPSSYMLQTNSFQPDIQRPRADLLQLRLDTIDILLSLEQEMNLLDEGANTFIKLQHLSSQTATLVDWNKTIQNALGLDIAGKA